MLLLIVARSEVPFEDLLRLKRRPGTSGSS
jgi:hypothetical protein